MAEADKQPERNKGGRPTEGKYHALRMPDELWQWCKAQTGNASETIRQLIRDAMQRDRQDRE